MKITVFTKPGCVQCNATYRQLDKSDEGYDKIDVTETVDVFDFLSNRGHSQMPVVMVSEEPIDVTGSNEIIDEWAGFNPDKIKTHAPVKEKVAA